MQMDFSEIYNVKTNWPKKQQTLTIQITNLKKKIPHNAH